MKHELDPSLFSIGFGWADFDMTPCAASHKAFLYII